MADVHQGSESKRAGSTDGGDEPDETAVVPRRGTQTRAPTGSAHHVSRYVVLEEVGRGAMGRVLRAYDPKLQREVALKEVRLGAVGRELKDVLDEEAMLRLVAEARAMARLSHPNVVAVYDVEELDGGEVILVMEYIAGQTLKAWRHQEQHPWRVIVRRFVEAGRGLAAAHGAGLLHRDFKPANVLVADGVTKVTDFGLAKAKSTMPGNASSEHNPSSEELTEAGMVMGTPRYMAPEQHDAHELTAAADQYAFCVALWEALCGKPPFVGGDMPADKRKGPPTWTHTRVPNPIAEAIVRGLSPQPEDRWPAMEALLDALAYDPSRRRHRRLTGLGAVGVLSLAGTSWAGWADRQARRCSGAAEQLAEVWDENRQAEVRAAIVGIDAPYAVSVWERTAEQLDGYAEAWAQMHTEACEATTVRGEQSEAVMDLRMACLHRAKVDLGAVVGVLGTADPTVVEKAHQVVGELRLVSKCADVDGLQAEVEPPDPQDKEAVEAARARLAEANAEREAGRYAQAQAKVDAARDALRDVPYVPVQAELAHAEGEVLHRRGDYDAAVKSLQRAVELGGRSRQWSLVGAGLRRLLYVVGGRQGRMDEGLHYLALARGLSTDAQDEAMVSNNLAIVLKAQGKYEEAESEQRQALSLWEKAPGPGHRTAALRNNLASILSAQGKYGEAEAEHRRALAQKRKTLGTDHPAVATSCNNLANVLGAQGKHEEAEAEFRRALGIQENALGAEHPNVAVSRNNLANVLNAQGKHEEAEAEQRRALVVWEKALGPEHPNVIGSRGNLALTLKAQGKNEEAEAEFRRVLALQGKALGPGHPDMAMSRANLALVLHAQRKYEEAEAEHRRALTLWEKELGPEHPNVAMSSNYLALALGAQGKYEEAEAEHRRALVLWERALDPDHPDVANSRTNLARLLIKRGEVDEAVGLAEQAWATVQRGDIPPERRARTAFVLARALWKAHPDAMTRKRARRLAERAAKEYGTLGSTYAAKLAEVESWLARPGTAGRVE